MSKNKKRNSNFPAPKRKNIWSKIIEIVVRGWIPLVGTGLIWGICYNQPNLTLEAIESDKHPFYQEFLLENVGTRNAIIKDVYINGMKLSGDFEWNQSNAHVGPLINAVDLILPQGQNIKFSLALFRPNITDALLYSNYREAAFSLEIYYYDTFKIKPLKRKITFSFNLRNNHWQLIGDFFKKNLGI